MLLTSAFLKGNSDISLEEFNVFPTSTWKLRVKLDEGCAVLNGSDHEYYSFFWGWRKEGEDGDGVRGGGWWIAVVRWLLDVPATCKMYFTGGSAETI